MKYLLDSNIVIAASLGIGGDYLHARMSACDRGDFVTSAVVYAEVIFGSKRGKPPPRESLVLLVEEVPILPFDQKAAETYANVPFRRASYDRLIAAHALALGLTLITDNVTDFAEVPGLSVENWMVGD